MRNEAEEMLRQWQLKAKVGTRDGVMVALWACGARRVAVLEAGMGGVGIVCEGGERDEIEVALDEVMAAGIAYHLVVWRAPWWWRLWVWVKRRLGL